MNEYTFSIDSFNQPETLTGTTAALTLLIRLLLLEPGKITQYPEMGVGIVKNYRYSLVDELSTLKTDISAQITQYIPALAAMSIDLSYDESTKDLKIALSDENGVYSVIDIDYENDTISLSTITS